MGITGNDGTLNYAPCVTSVLDKCIGHAYTTGNFDVLKAFLSQKKFDNSIAVSTLSRYFGDSLGCSLHEGGRIHTGLVAPKTLIAMGDAEGAGFIVSQIGERNKMINNLLREYKP